MAAGPHQEFTISDPRITESSGLAASAAHPGVFWTHNDSDDGPYVYAVDATGHTVATVTLRGVKPRDAEAISLGPDGQLYLADIGDNLDGTWPEVWIYRFAEPKDLRDQTVDAVRYRVRYEDGSRNAEALMVHPVTGRLYIASKRESGGNLYQGPQTLSTTAVNTFRKVSAVPWVTDGAFSPDGTRLLLRGYFWATMYRWQDGGAPQELGDVSLPFQRQGESATFAADGRSVLFGSEGKDSPVWRVQLSGEQLPDTVRLATPTASASPAPSGASSGASPGGAGQAAGGTSDTVSGRGLLVLFLVVGALAAASWRKKRHGS
ncbi:esterase-like activity of phytase family protein [Kitasatospora sp. NBC_00315]